MSTAYRLLEAKLYDRAVAIYELVIAEDFNNVYEYLLKRLVEANLKKDAEILEEVLKHLRTMRDTWKEVMRLNAIKTPSV